MIKLGIFSGDFNWRKGIFPFSFLLIMGANEFLFIYFHGLPGCESKLVSGGALVFGRPSMFCVVIMISVVFFMSLFGQSVRLASLDCSEVGIPMCSKRGAWGSLSWH